MLEILVVICSSATALGRVIPFSFVFQGFDILVSPEIVTHKLYLNFSQRLSMLSHVETRRTNNTIAPQYGIRAVHALLQREEGPKMFCDKIAGRGKPECGPFDSLHFR